MLHKKQVHHIKAQKKDQINIIFRILFFSLALIIPVSQSFAKIDNGTLRFYSKNNILYYDPTGNNDNCIPSSNIGIWAENKYNLTENQLRGVLAMAEAENSGSLNSVKSELSLMLNVYEKYTSKPYTPDRFITYITKPGGWFGTYNEYNESFQPTYSGELETAKSIINEGNRTLPPQILEHDMFGDIKKISNDNGTTWISSRSDIQNRSNYKEGTTLIIALGDPYVFYTWADPEEKTGDPFGYFPNNPPEQKPSNTTINTNTVEGILWNLLIDKGFSSKQVAGIIGNAMQESSLNPVRVGILDKSYHGLFMWKDEYGWDRVEAALKDAGMEKYLTGQYPEISSSEEIEKLIPKDDLKKIIEIQIDAVIKINSDNWVSEIKKSNSVEESAEIFLVLFEKKAIDGSDPIKYYKNNKYYNKLYQETTKRREYALEFYEKFGNASICGYSSDGGDPLAFLQQYIIDTNKTYGFNYKIPDSFTLGIVLKTPDDDSATKTGSCWGATYCGQCTALSGWFVRKMTDYQLDSTGNGGQTVNKIVLKNSGLETSRTPTAFSVFSYSSGEYGHTGVVVAVDDSGGITTIENNSDSNHHLAVRYYLKIREGVYQQEGGKERDMFFVDLSAKVHLEHLGEK